MAIDSFSAQLVKYVRNMSDEAILALVKNQLDRVTGSGSVAAPAAVTSSAVAAPKAGRKPGPKPKAAPPPPPPTAPKPPAPRPGLIAAKPAGRPPVAKAAPKPAIVAKPAARPTLAKPAAMPKSAPKAAALPKAAARPVVKAKPPVKAKPAKRGRGAAAGRTDLLGSVERVVKSSNGLSASEIAKSAGVPQSRVSSALKELKDAKRVFQGGDRRFARYAGDARTAEQASVNARRTAPGPILKKGKRR